MSDTPIDLARTALRKDLDTAFRSGEPVTAKSVRLIAQRTVERTLAGLEQEGILVSSEDLVDEMVDKLLAGIALSVDGDPLT